MRCVQLRELVEDFAGLAVCFLGVLVAELGRLTGPVSAVGPGERPHGHTPGRTVVIDKDGPMADLLLVKVKLDYRDSDGIRSVGVGQQQGHEVVAVDAHVEITIGDILGEGEARALRVVDQFTVAGVGLPACHAKAQIVLVENEVE